MGKNFTRMTDRARKLLDNLLGHNRDNIEHTKHSDCCIYQIAGGCPYELLKNTKLSIGACKYKSHDVTNSVYKILYEQELLNVLSDIVENTDKKINIAQNDRSEVFFEQEYELELRLDEIEHNITENTMFETYKKFQDIENEIYNLEKLKENYNVKNKHIESEKCDVCGMSIIKNFCGKKYQMHVLGRAHRGMRTIRELYSKLRKQQGF